LIARAFDRASWEQRTVADRICAARVAKAVSEHSLAVEPQQVVLGKTEATDGCVGFQATMWPMPIVARRNRSISSTTAWGVGCRSRCGREERSCNPANPSRRYRSTHFRTVRGQTPAASATASGVCPLSTCPTIRLRPRGVILVHVHPVLPRIAEASQLQLPWPGPGGQPNESSQLANVR
jgi:hypothetical protein